MSLKIYPDGCCLGNPGPGGFAAIVVQDDKVIDILQRYSPQTTNNIMEILAIREAIIYCIENNVPECKIYSDSQYAINGITDWSPKWKAKGWVGSKHKPIKNLEIWREMESLWRQAKNTLNISLHYVKGHANSKYNNLADTKAREIVNKYAKNNEV